MKERKFVIGALAGLLFMAFVALNLTISQNYQGDNAMNRFTLVDLAAEAQGGGGEYHGCYPLPAESTTYERCPGYEGSWVIRCACGPGSCDPSDQDLCP